MSWPGSIERSDECRDIASLYSGANERFFSGSALEGVDDDDDQPVNVSINQHVAALETSLYG